MRFPGFPGVGGCSSVHVCVCIIYASGVRISKCVCVCEIDIKQTQQTDAQTGGRVLGMGFELAECGEERGVNVRLGLAELHQRAGLRLSGIPPHAEICATAAGWCHNKRVFSCLR